MIFGFMSPDEAILRVMAGPLIIGLIAMAIAIPLSIRRKNMAINEPDKYRRTREWEEEEKERYRKAKAEAVETGMKVATVIAKLVSKK